MRKRLIYSALILSCALSCVKHEHRLPVVDAQETPIIANDISNQKVTSFMEDSQGHIWISTFRGLNRFNVHEYHQHFCTGDEQSLPDNQVQCVFRDSRDRLWVSTVNGMALHTEQDDFIRVPMNTLSRNSVQILEDKNGRIFINTMVEIAMYDEETREFVTVLSSAEGQMPAAVQMFFSPLDNELLLASTTHIGRYDSQSFEFKDAVTLNGMYSYFMMFEDGVIWMSSENGMALYSLQQNRFLEIPVAIRNHKDFGKSNVTYIYQYTPDTVILCTERNGMYIYDKVENVLKHQSEKGFPFEVPDMKITCMYTDSRDNLWIGSYDQGYSVIYNYEERFNNDSWLKTSLGNKSVVSVAADSKGCLWINTLKDGLYFYDPSSEYFNKVDFKPSQDITSVFVDREDKVWLACNKGVARFNVSGSSLKFDKDWPAFMPMAISQDKDGRIWVGTMGESVYCISPEDEQLRLMKTVSAPFTFTPCCLPLNDGSVLSASFDQGFSLIDGKQNHVRQLAIPQSMWDECIQRSVFVPCCMHQTADGIIWVGTLANGLLKYDLKRNVLSPVHGTPCLDITAIEEDANGNLWISTQYGLGKYDRSTEEFTNWFADDGIGGNQFYDRASCTLPDGTLVFGGTHGLTFFDPENVVFDRDIQVYFEDLKIHNVLVRPSEDECITKSLTYNPDINLEHSQNCFSISFAALDYSEYERVDYQYRLEGFDGHWIDAHNNREAYYSNIPGGRYTFKVRATNRDKSIIFAENSIKVRVEPPFWLTWWALLVYILISAGIVRIIMRARREVNEEKQLKVKAQQEKEQERKVNQMNMSFFANISHEFRTPLTMIAGPVAQLAAAEQMTDDNKRLLDIVQRNIRRMLRLVNQLLDFNKLENDTLKLKVKEVDIIAQLNNLSDIFREMAKEKGVIFTTFGLEESFKAWIDDDKMDKMCFNLLSNAMKFTARGGKVEFILDVITREDAQELFELKASDTDSRWLKIQVKDSGPGLPEDQLERIFERYYQLENQVRGSYNWGTGIGLYFARTLATMHHGYLKAGNRTTSRGAVFTLLLPISESSYQEHEKLDMGGAAHITPSPLPCIKYSETQPESEDDNSDKKIVFVVDDDVDVVNYLKEMLSSEYKVYTAFNVDTAYALMKEKAPDVVISDVVMPEKTGYDLCRKMKENIQMSHIPVILLTAMATVEDQVQGLDSGADAYVTKPFEPQYLKALIASQLRNRAKVRTMLSESTDVQELEEDVLSPQDNAFMTELYQLMENELSNSELDVSRMTELLHMSRTKFYYKVKGLTGENPSVFFKRYKLNRAAQLILERKYNVSEIADMTGFSTLSHFSTSFKKQFGVSPSEYSK